MNLKQNLKEYGLTSKESDIYLALLPLGSVTLQELAKRIDLPRTTIYNTLNYLTNKGIVSFIVKKNIKHYESTDPEKLIDKLREKEALIKDILPNLKILKKATIEGSSVEIYQGTKGISTILYDVFSKKQQTYYFGSYKLSKELLKFQPEHVRTIRLERKIPANIVMDKYDEETFHKPEYKKLTEIRYNNSLKDFPCMIFIYGNKVALYTLKEDVVGIIIKNKQVATSMKLIFDIYWHNAKKMKL
ncbi:MAG: helix-turn-helix domain-containing protein [Candidatus Woesearchaeota archaeon]|jgi:sugar-specific transcriptional regulator TrmB